jgi:hypothetical protein
MSGLVVLNVSFVAVDPQRMCGGIHVVGLAHFLLRDEQEGHQYQCWNCIQSLDSLRCD